MAGTSDEQFHEILNLRCILENHAARDSLNHGDADWEDALVLAHHRLSRSDRTDREGFETAHRSFHMAILAACTSPILLRFCSQLYDLNVRYRYLAGQSKGYDRRDVVAEHLGILNAAVDRDGEELSARLIQHYQNTGAFLLSEVS